MTKENREGLTVFVSSSIDEFENLRRRLGKEIDDVGFLTSIVLEDKGARPVPVLDESLNQAKTCDVLVIVLGEKYSEITVKEFDEARTAGIPCFVYVLDVMKRDSRVEQFIKEKVQPFLKYQTFSTTDELVDIVRNDMESFVGQVLRLGIEAWKVAFPNNAIPEIPKVAPARHVLGEKFVPQYVSRASKTLADYLKFEDKSMQEFNLARTGPQWVRILAVLSHSGSGVTSYKLTSATGIYGAVLWLRLRDLVSQGLVEGIQDGKKTKYKLSERGASALRQWLDKKKGSAE